MPYRDTHDVLNSLAPSKVEDAVAKMYGHDRHHHERDQTGRGEGREKTERHQTRSRARCRGHVGVETLLFDPDGVELGDRALHPCAAEELPATVGENHRFVKGPHTVEHQVRQQSIAGDRQSQ